MIEGDLLVLPPAARDEAKAYLRVVGVDEDPLLDRLLRSAAELGERFTGQVLLRRAFRERIGPAGAGRWQRLGRTPVRAVTAVETGAGTPLPAEAYAIDLDSSGDGWVRLIAPPDGPVTVSYDAGLAASWAELPEALRHGALRLAAHFYTHRDGAASTVQPPAAVTALWRPWRRMRLG